MIRITSNLDFDLRVPYPTPKGMKPNFFVIPKRKTNDKGEVEQGQLELDELDNITIERLRHHYERRTVDAKEKGNESAPHHEIGLLKIEIVNGKASKPKAVAA